MIIDKRSLIHYILTMSDLIQPKILKGFRDFLPQEEILRSSLIEKLTKTYQSYGFVPIDTPVLEYTEILLRKSQGETEKQMFRFEDNGGRDVAMRFDLTVPFARYTAQHKEELYFPFKRYHISKVWRGEKPQAGRYREFVQCDFDTVGSDSATSDFETLSLMRAALRSIGVEKITIHVNHRGIFNRFLSKQGLADKSEDILRTVDKLAKIGEEEVKKELITFTGDQTKAELILSYIKPEDSFEKTLSHLEELAGGPGEDTKRMRDIYAMMQAEGIENTYTLDPSITRGLDYYTGVVYETFLDDLPHLNFDLLQDLRGENGLGVDVIIEAVVDGGSDGQLGIGIEPLDRLRQYVRRRVAIGKPPIRIVKGVEGDFTVMLQRKGQTMHLPVHGGGKDLAGKALGNLLGHLQQRRAFLDLDDAAVFQFDLDHSNLLGRPYERLPK